MGIVKPLMALAAVVVLMVAGAGALDAANADAERGAGTQTQVNESFSGATTGYDVAQGTDNDTYSASHEIVVKDSSGTELASNKYKWDSENGTLTTTSTSSGTIAYSVYTESATTSGILNIAKLPIEAGEGIIWLLFVFVVVGAFLVVKEVAT